MLIDALTTEGFTPEGAQWMATNLKPTKGGQLDWTFDLKGINELCGSWSKRAVLAAPQPGNSASSEGPSGSGLLYALERSA